MATGRVEATTMVPAPPALGDEARDVVLRLAREAVAAAVEGRGMRLPRTLPPQLVAEAAVFVTLSRHGELRACIGRLDPGMSLARNLLEAAKGAATIDPRFDPITRTELSSLHIEVSVLGPLTSIEDPAAYDPETMGIVIGRRGRRGLLLPQVARERGWGREAMLEAVCWKAGLPDDAWRDPECHLEVFRATILEEPDRSGPTPTAGR
jgi:AmmeMemoRadiSam system protein A